MHRITLNEDSWRRPCSSRNSTCQSERHGPYWLIRGPRGNFGAKESMESPFQKVHIRFLSFCTCSSSRSLQRSLKHIKFLCCCYLFDFDLFDSLYSPFFEFVVFWPVYHVFDCFYAFCTCFVTCALIAIFKWVVVTCDAFFCRLCWSLFMVSFDFVQLDC